MNRNKRKERTEQLLQVAARRRMCEMADNAIEQHRFDKLVKSGVIMALNKVENPKTTVLANIMFEAQRQ